jgi:hypothetical protein
MIDPVKAFGYIRVQYIFRLLFNCGENRPDCIMRATAGSETVAVWFKLSFPFRFHDHFH